MFERNSPLLLLRSVTNKAGKKRDTAAVTARYPVSQSTLTLPKDGFPFSRE